MLLIFTFVGGIGWLAGPRIANQFDLLLDRIPEALDFIESMLNQYEWGRKILSRTVQPEQWMSREQNLSAVSPVFFSTTLGWALNAILILVLGIYLAVGPILYLNAIYYLVPEKKQQRVKELVQVLGRALHWWLAGRLSMMVIVGVLIGIGLWILNVPLALSLGFLAFLLSFVPILGPIASAIPAILIGLLQSASTALYVLVLFVVVQSLESYFITPLIQERTVLIPPVALISAQMLMAFLTGMIGVFLATPLTVVVVVLIQMLYVEDILGYKVKLLGEH